MIWGWGGQTPEGRDRRGGEGESSVSCWPPGGVSETDRCANNEAVMGDERETEKYETHYGRPPNRPLELQAGLGEGNRTMSLRVPAGCTD